MLWELKPETRRDLREGGKLGARDALEVPEYLFVVVLVLALAVAINRIAVNKNCARLN